MVAKLRYQLDKTKRSFIISGMRNCSLRNSLYIFLVGPSAPPNGFDVTFQVKEKRFLTSTTGTEIGNNEGSMVSGTCPDGVRIIILIVTFCPINNNKIGL